MRRKPQPPPRPLSIFSRLVILFGGVYATGGWLLAFFITAGFWAGRWGLIEANFILGIVAIPLAFICGASLLKSLRAGSLAVKLLRKGEFTWGTLVETENTAMQYNEKALKWVEKMGIANTDKDGNKITEEELRAKMQEEMERQMKEQPQSVIMKYHLTFKARDGKDYTTKAEVSLQTGAKVGDEEKEPILYWPNNPNKAVVFDAISHVPEIWPDGSFSHLPAKKAVYLILPFVTITMNAFCVLMDVAA